MEGKNKTKTVQLRQATTEELYREVERRQKSEITKELLMAIAATTTLMAGAILAPKLTAYLCKLIYKRTQNRQFLQKKQSVKKALGRLRQQELIAISEDGKGKVTITLAEKGRKRILKYQIESISIKKPNQWDRKWRIIIFDIPEKQRLGRDVLRDKFKTLGLYQLQKSVWVYPYPCQNEVDFISNVYGVARYLLYFETNNLENEQFLISKFNLRG